VVRELERDLHTEAGRLTFAYRVPDERLVSLHLVVNSHGPFERGRRSLPSGEVAPVVGKGVREGELGYQIAHSGIAPPRARSKAA
jgi:hypothetical protein